MQNIIASELGFRYYAKVAQAQNNLPDLDLRESDSWRILKVIKPPAQATKAPIKQTQPAEALAPKPISLPAQALTDPRSTQAPTPESLPTQVPTQEPKLKPRNTSTH